MQLRKTLSLVRERERDCSRRLEAPGINYSFHTLVAVRREMDRREGKTWLHLPLALLALLLMSMGVCASDEGRLPVARHSPHALTGVLDRLHPPGDS